MIFSACTISSERLGPRVLRQFGEVPVVLHLGVQEVLIDRRQLAGQLLVEQTEDFGITLHEWILLPRWAVGRVRPLTGTAIKSS